MRDLVRARAAAVETLRVHRQQISAFMLKHSRVYPRKKGWTMRYLRWLQEQQFDHPAHQIALQEMVDAVRVSKERVERLEKVIGEFIPSWSLGPVVRALQTLRGVELIVAVTFATEVGDVTRFESPRQLMGYLGLVPGERSTGETVRSRRQATVGLGICWLRAPGHIDIRRRSARKSYTAWSKRHRKCARSRGRLRAG